MQSNKMNLQWLSNTEDISVFAELSHESDRIVAIVATAVLDDVLSASISASLIPDPDVLKRFMKDTGPLSTFAARIDFAYLTGVLSKEGRDDLRRIAKIRNLFAHGGTKLEFTTAPMCDHCKNLTMPERVDSLQHEYAIAFQHLNKPIDEIDLSSPRTRFLRTAQVMNNLLVVVASNAKPSTAGPVF